MIASVHSLSPLACQWFADSPLSTSAYAYLCYLHKRGYAAGIIKEYFNGIEHLAHWLKAQEADLTGIGDHPRICRSGFGDEEPGIENASPLRPKHRRDTARRTVFYSFAELIVM
ncbi:hypothetical protein [Marinobacter sp. ELB17]|uniref:hypothetical protein n=1 Tax=Marinobacter sp. ELB17 TaxID=270374 RepID=UPI0000F39C50|nr:hypothetical protein [Marinobacter sp. ELB17]EAZ97057.1 hypothetical protein MELB17_10708 [Marinobacter sp. ELB17]EAZ97435.1 hypothetical protein MELB17_21360 [Marinobacter sp. ELB17]EAZ99550.1 hypothetical protein MELB17_20576 [Marinobacter sp. ELB17]